MDSICSQVETTELSWSGRCGTSSSSLLTQAVMLESDPWPCPMTKGETKSGLDESFEEYIFTIKLHFCCSSDCDFLWITDTGDYLENSVLTFFFLTCI